MDDLAAQRLARAVLEPGEALLWSEAAPSQPAAAVHFAIALILLIVAAGVVWVGLQAWRLGLPAARELKNKLLTVLSVVALGGATIAGVIAIVLLSIFAAINAAKAANDGSAAYMITDRRAGFVYGLSGTRYVEPLELSLLRITRTGNSLRLGQPLGTEVFGVVLDPVFYQVSDPNRVAALLRRVAEETTSPPPLRVAPMPTDQGTLAAISSALYASERVIWAQRADGRPGVFQATAVSIASGSIGLVLLIAALLGALQAKRRWFMLGIIAPAGIALSLVAVANAGRALGAGSLYYALTNQRVIIVRVEPWFAVRSYEPFFFDETMRVYADDNSVISCRIAATRGCQGVRLDGVHHADAVVAAIRAQLAGREP